MSACAAIIGILGVALGLWWADAAAALFISVEIIRSGWHECANAFGDVMDRRPRKLGGDEIDPLPEKLTRLFRQQDWIQDVVVRLRDRGREFVAEAFVVPSSESVVPARLEALSREACQLDERLRHIGIVPLPQIPEEFQRVRADQ